MISFRSLSALLILVSANTSALASDGYFPLGHGIKSQGMGGAGIALPQDALAAAINPAGMAFTPDRADVGLAWFSPVYSTQISGNSFAGVSGTYDADNRSSFVPEFGYVKKISPATTVGLAIYVNGGMDTQYVRDLNRHDNAANIPYVDLGGSTRIGRKLEQIFISPSLAYRLNAHNALGLNLNFAHQRFSGHGLIPIPTTAFDTTYLPAPNLPTPSLPAPYPSESGSDTANGWGLSLGWTGQPTPKLMLGATWSSRVRSGPLGTDSGLFANDGSFDIPENYGVGLSYSFAPTWTFAADISRIKYGSVNSAAPSSSPYTILGWPNGPGFGWNDVTVVKAGLSHEYSPTLTLRAGYNHSGQAIPASRTYLNILAPNTVQDHLTLGFTWKVSATGELSAAYIHGFKNTLNGMNSIPAIQGGGNANISTEENSLGLAYGWKL